jgi:hypothetical protein
VEERFEIAIPEGTAALPEGSGREFELDGELTARPRVDGSPPRHACRVFPERIRGSSLPRYYSGRNRPAVEHKRKAA